MGFGRYVLHRLLLVVPTLFGVTLISFALVYVLPGNPALVKAGSLATPEHVAAIERQMGLDRPVHVQYWRYLTGLLRADLGESSSTGRPVLEDFRQRVPATLELTLASLLVAAAIGIPLGVLSAVHGDALGNALIPVITLLGVIFGFLMAGNVVVEMVFAWPGLGHYAVTSLVTKDAGPIQSFVLFVAVMYVLVNLSVDLLYGLADPRIRLR